MAFFASSVVFVLPSELHGIPHALPTRAKAVAARWKLLVTANLATYSASTNRDRMNARYQLDGLTFAGPAALPSFHLA